ncbi:carbohydrate binding family 9 domain-containing protein [Flavobacteriaceae bacterium]|nr:carbohydrate binding family 9 domain-containing protein [Flavobacteriaceae bacterium]MDA9338673.1 carbohydrate binding family 9 domain-containing protein [Flavobacteriaceae bacterium]
MKRFCVLFFVLFITFNYSQNRKEIKITRFNNPPKIDGIINDSQWNGLEPAIEFERWMPNNGQKEREGYESFIYLGYDDTGIYIAGKFNDPNPSLIPLEFSQRDNIWEVNADSFWLSINTNDDNLNDQGFQVTSAGTLGDTYTSGEFSEDDWNFDTVFEAKVSIDENGWNMEMKIPYSALRFPSSDIQSWGIQFSRRIIEFGEFYTWNYIDTKTSTFRESLGLLNGLKNISPPTRLFFYPYLQSSVDLNKNNRPLSGYSAGMDLKYGISNNFTLDATLIPDFGQVAFDEKELNLSPFEQKFDENRAFFTEGSQLFKKADTGGRRGGNFFYSRRIGDDINLNTDELIEDNEELISYETKSNLVNSIKLTGTTNSGLSIGIINSITEKAYANVKDLNTQEIKNKLIAPLTNYNVVSLSQTALNKYSTFSFLNTNVNRGDDFKGSNNSALVVDLYDNDRKFNINANLFQSNSKSFSDTKGFRGGISLSELTGSLRFDIGWNGVDANYYQNDLGYYNLRNDQRLWAKVGYMTFQPTKLYEKIEAYLWMSERSRFYPKILKSQGGRIGLTLTSLKLEEIRASFDYTSKYKDFEETRKEDFFIYQPAEYELEFNYRSDTRKKLVYGSGIEHSYGVNEQFNENSSETEIEFYFGYRLSNQFKVELGISNGISKNEIGYVFDENDNLYFGNRKVKFTENNISLNYNFNSYKSLNLKFRQFWSSALYKEDFFLLKSDGNRSVSEKNISDYNPNTNFNLWNLDLSYDWEFAPGSKITLLYRNNIFNENNLSGISYYNSTKELFEKPINHQLSLRINYFIDFNLLKKKKV